VSPRVLVTDGEQRAALAVVRSLGTAGHAVHVCSGSCRSIAGASRHATAEHRVTDPLRAPARFAADVATLVHTLEVDVLLPISEAAALALLPIRSELGAATVPFPDFDQFRRISDKATVLRVADEIGLATPRQVVVRFATDSVSAGLPATMFPVVLKPARSVVDNDTGRLKLGVWYATSADELATALAALPEAAYPLLLQQRIIGPGIGIFLLMWDGRTQAVFAHRRIREKPVTGGVSVYRESVPPDRGLVERSRALLERFDWQGVAMVEYKVDTATGVAYLMEVNGRFWGSLQLAIDAGVDFPALLVSLACGERPAPVLTYRTGVRSRWWLGDIDHLVQRFRLPRAALPAGTPGRGKTLLEFLTLWRPGDRGEVFRWHDPRPGLREAALWLRGR
jgi:predicted ATP-grasp superfamily ATP-dependent carboligase